jgi:hypothetical protein
MADAITVAPRRSEAVARIIPAAHVASCVSSLTNGPSLTITGAVTGFEGFEGSGRAIAVMPAPWVDRIGSRRTPSSFRRCRACCREIEIV